MEKDGSRGRSYAMKIYGNLFNKDVELMKTVWNELFLVRSINTIGGHPNIVKWIRHVETPEFENEHFDYAASLYELMDADLHFALQHNQFTIREAQYCLFNVLNAIYFLHENNLVHQNISSQTVLVTTDFDVKITNFRHCVNTSDMKSLSKTYLTANVKSYRAPEILMQSFDTVSLPIDIFAAGCLFAEVLLRKPLFEAKHYLEQLELLVELVGVPDISDLSGISYLATKSLQRVHNSGCFVHDTFEETFPMLKDHPDALDLLRKMLAFWPKDRITVQEAIQHPFFDSLRDKFFSSRQDQYKSLRTPEYKVDMYYERPLLLKNLICNELALGRKQSSSIFTNVQHMSQVFDHLCDIDIITSASQES